MEILHKSITSICPGLSKLAGQNHAVIEDEVVAGKFPKLENQTLSKEPVEAMKQAFVDV
jgi:hypothetical protein